MTEPKSIEGLSHSGETIEISVDVQMGETKLEYQVRLTIGVQSFTICQPRETLAEATWLMEQLSKALESAALLEAPAQQPDYTLSEGTVPNGLVQWGPILDALDGLPNDLRPEFENLDRLIRLEHERQLLRIEAEPSAVQPAQDEKTYWYEGAPTQQESDQCDADFKRYVHNLKGFTAHADSFRAGWMINRAHPAAVQPAQEPVATIVRLDESRESHVKTLLTRWEDGAASLAAGEYKLYASPIVPAIPVQPVNERLLQAATEFLALNNACAGANKLSAAIASAESVHPAEQPKEQQDHLVSPVQSEGAKTALPGQASDEALMTLVRRIGLARFDEGYAAGRRQGADRNGAKETAERLEAELRSRLAQPAKPASWDEKALEVARRFTQDTEPQRRASLQVAVLGAMRWAAPTNHIVDTNKMVVQPAREVPPGFVLALKAAVAAIYFDDSSDFPTAL